MKYKTIVIDPPFDICVDCSKMFLTENENRLTVLVATDKASMLKNARGKRRNYHL